MRRLKGMTGRLERMDADPRFIAELAEQVPCNADDRCPVFSFLRAEPFEVWPS